MPTQCLISFGSNLGDRDRVIAEAARLIAESDVVTSFEPTDQTSSKQIVGGLRASRLFETPPIGGPGGQDAFLNAVAAFATKASAAAVLDTLQEIEEQLGRERRARWSARSIDLDVVLHGRLSGVESRAGRRGLIGGRGPAGSSRALVVPHPRYTARKFVLEPACDVAADFCDPRFGWTIADITEHLASAVPSMALAGGDEDLRRELCERLHRDHGIQIHDPDQDSCDALDQSVPWISPNVPGCLQSVGFATPEKGVEWDDRKTSQLPRLIARIQKTTPTTRWPAPHQIWPAGWRWPEYRLEVDDLDWAIGEVASAFDSMSCEVRAVTDDGQWW